LQLHAPPEHVALAPQELPQEPQFEPLVIRFDSQPSAHEPLQLP
jgi:hypothetical protein